MCSKLSRRNNYILQVLSLMFGFLLMILLSMQEVWSSYFVVALVFIMSSLECLWLRNIKGIEEYHWLSSNWLLLASAVIYILTDSLVTKIMMFGVMVLSLYLNLYRTVYYEPFSIGYIKIMVKDFPLLCFNYVAALFKRNEYLEIRTKKEKRFVGICILAVVLIGIIFPLYICMDNRMGLILKFIVIKLITFFPVCIICGLLGVIPAVINYSIVRGLVEDIVLHNPSRNKGVVKILNNEENIFWNDTVINIVLGGLTVINIVAIGLQISTLFNQIMNRPIEEILHNMEKELPLLIAIMVGVLFIALSHYWILHNASKKSTQKLVFTYILSLILLRLLLICHYILKVFTFGIAETDVYGICIVFLVGIVLVLLMLNSTTIDANILQKVVTYSVIVFVVLSLFPSEYVISQINVRVFLDKYQKSEIENQVTSQDIDLEYLEKMGYEAVPALMLLMDISLEYDLSQEPLNKTINDLVVKMFYVDMNDEEISKIENLGIEEQKEQLVKILSEKVEYRVIGRRKTALMIYCEKYWK